MPYLFTAAAGAREPEKTLTVDEYANRLYAEVLTPHTQSFGFKTYYNSKTEPVPILINEEEYLKRFRRYWDTALEDVADQFGVSKSEVLNPTTTAVPGSKEVFLVVSVADLVSVLKLPLKEFTVTEQLDLSDMATRPTLQTTGLPSVSEDNNSASSPARKSAKIDVLKRLRPPPLPLVWCWWHDRVDRVNPSTTVPTTAQGTPNTKPLDPSDTTHEDNLRCIEQIADLKAFWEVYNNFPFDRLILRDTVHLFQRKIKPVWEDPSNVRGGSWTFRVPKSLSMSFFTKILIMAASGQLLEAVVDTKDILCGVSMSIRFNSNLVTIWNGNGSNQKTIDAILALVLSELPEDVNAKDISYFYKKHSDHQGFNEALAASKAAEKKAEEAMKSENVRPGATVGKSNLSTSKSATTDETDS